LIVTIIRLVCKRILKIFSVAWRVPAQGAILKSYFDIKIVRSKVARIIPPSATPRSVT
jgi:hypothetical protein